MKALLRTTALGLSLLTGLAGYAAAQQTESISTLAPKGSKLATITEVVPEKQEAAMLTPGSVKAMRSALQMYQEIVARGGWPVLPEAKLRKGAKSDDVITLRQRLVAEAYLPPEAISVAKPTLFDDQVAAAVMAFQGNHGLAPSGKIEGATLNALNVSAEERMTELQINYRRITAYSEGLGDRYILVNIPSTQLETVNYGTVYSRHNVVVGKVDRPSPSVKSTIREINFNPYWNVPESIAGKDLIPKLIADPHALAAMRIRVFDGHEGPEVDPTTVDWTLTPPGRYFFRQDPGKGNSLGLVKINFPNKYHVYLHDTPHKELFNQNVRYESSGCIRIDKVNTVVDWILNGQQGFDHDLIEEMTQSEQRSDVKVANAPELRIMYLTAWATEDGRVNFRPDIYGMDSLDFVYGQPVSGGGGIEGDTTAQEVAGHDS